jgi:hypothetical protein
MTSVSVLYVVRPAADGTPARHGVAENSSSVHSHRELTGPEMKRE